MDVERDLDQLLQFAREVRAYAAGHLDLDTVELRTSAQAAIQAIGRLRRVEEGVHTAPLQRVETVQQAPGDRRGEIASTVAELQRLRGRK